MLRRSLILVLSLHINQYAIAVGAVESQKELGPVLVANTICDASAHQNSTFRENLFEIFLNNQNLKETVLVLTGVDGRLWLREQDLNKWRLQLQNNQSIVRANDRYTCLDSIAALSYKVDDSSQSLKLTIPSENLQTSFIKSQHTTSETPSMPTAGGFLNYDANAVRIEGRNNLAAQLELGVFAAGGVATSQFISKNFGDGHRTIRLDSTLTIDQPLSLNSIRLGDAISRGGTWGKSLRYGGIQWNTNFSTQPDLITIPLPSLNGTAALPSVAEVFVNNMKISQQDIIPGPFSLQDIPVVNGQGDVRMVVKDLLGREQIITQPFYATRTLLKKGLSDYSYELGVEREKFGIVSNSYGNWFFSGTHRTGLADQWTGEIRSELTSAHQALGISSTNLIPGLGMADIGLVGSRSDTGQGIMLLMGVDKQMPKWNFGVQIQLSSKNFKQLGLPQNELAPRMQTTVHAGWSDEQFGSWGVGYIKRDARSDINREILSTNYNKNLGKSWFLGAYANKNLTATRSITIGFSFTHVFDDLSTASLNSNHQKDANYTQIQIQKNMPTNEGVGYSVLADLNTSNRFEGNLKTQSEYGIYSFQLARAHSDTAASASVSGGVALLGGQAFLTKRVNDSFAVVRVGDYPNVQVYAENQTVGRTNSAGVAFVSGLRPYQKNRISIEQADIPLDVQIGALEINAVPYFRSGYEAVFPVKKSLGAVLEIVLENGIFPVGGAFASLNGGAEVFPVTSDGRTYMAGLTLKNNVQVFLPDSKKCSFEVSYIPSTDPLPNLGSFICKELKP